jgi:hypothetical protein
LASYLNYFLAVSWIFISVITIPAFAADSPKLVLQVTVDQLRGDLPTRYSERLGEGGFRYLWENGVVYKNAHHAHANTETIVGHSTLALIGKPDLRLTILKIRIINC